MKLKKFYGKTIIGWLNYLVLQFLFVRLAYCKENDDILDIRLIGFILPTTGWRNEYIYLKEFEIILYKFH